MSTSFIFLVSTFARHRVKHLYLHIMITYNKYPLLLHTSFTKEDAPEELPIEVVSPEVRKYLVNCQGYKEIFALIAIRNSEQKANSNTHYWLDDKLFPKVDSGDEFRNNNFRNFFLSKISPKNGVILFPDGGQYLYILLDREITKKLKGVDGRYIAVALFRENTFIGFEEGFITDRGVQVSKTGYYANDMPIGGYISFAIITLGYAGERKYPLMETPVKEDIIKL